LNCRRARAKLGSYRCGITQKSPRSPITVDHWGPRFPLTTSFGWTAVRILALETTEMAGSLAAMHDGKLLAELELDPRQRTAQSLAPGMKTLLAKVAWRPADVELVAVTIGPGSFTGLRLGITTAKTFAYALGAEPTRRDSRVDRRRELAGRSSRRNIRFRPRPPQASRPASQGRDARRSATLASPSVNGRSTCPTRLRSRPPRRCMDPGPSLFPSQRRRGEITGSR